MSTSPSSPPLQPTETNSTETSRVGGERLLTVKEAARSLGLCVDSVRRHLRSGKLQGVRVGGGWRVPESKLAVQLGLLAVAAVPALDVMEDERKHIGPKTTIIEATRNGSDNQLLDTLFQTEPVRARVLQLVEAAGISASVASTDRAQLAHELEKVLGNLNDEARDLEA